MPKIYALLGMLAASVCASPLPQAAVPLVTFDGSSGTTFDWVAVNDPVMGGQSTGNFSTTAAVGEWQGQVKIVPFLHAPGFCNAQAPGLSQEAKFADASGSSHISLRARTVGDNELSHFNMILVTKGASKLFKQGQYMANYTLSSDWQDVSVPLDQFICTWRAQPVTWCPPLAEQLNQITNIGVGTAFPGKAGKFHVEIASISAN